MIFFWQAQEEQGGSVETSRSNVS